ncbi:MAG: aminotransferase class IV [Polyangiales bacterium]
MSGKIAVDGELADEAEARVSAVDRALLFGEGAFESIRTYGGEPFALGEHLARLERSCERLGIELPVARQVLACEVREAIAAAQEPECYVRVMITGGRGLGPGGAQGGPTRIVIARRLPPPPRTLRREGAGVVLVPASLTACGGPAGGAKVLSFLGYQLAASQARAAGAEEAVLHDGEGRLLEGATSNLFVVHADRLRTPPASAGILDGITRRAVIGLARVERWDVREAELFPRDLYDADEAFFTNSLREIVPIVRADGRPVHDGRPGPRTRRLQAAFRAMTGPCRLEGAGEGV